jgi:hypothetical protein
MYVYIRATGEHNLFVVGFYSPTGEFVPESDHSNKGSAAARVHYLNGGERPKERH